MLVEESRGTCGYVFFGQSNAWDHSIPVQIPFKSFPNKEKKDKEAGMHECCPSGLGLQQAAKSSVKYHDRKPNNFDAT